MSDAVARLGAALAGRFTIERELGAGGMATVYLARDLKHRRSVAMKVLRPELSAALGRERFLREIEIIAQLSHAHILPLHDSDVVDDVYYFIMPYVEGESLDDALARAGPLPIEDALRIAREVADALAYAHARGVIHRDIKPHNIMLEAGHAWVTDFGIAHLLDRTWPTDLTETGVSLGTPQYMSPEQIGGARHVDARTDIYSLGCVLYEMLTGQPPFTGPTMFAIIARQAAEPPPGVRIVRPTVSESLEHVLLKALGKVPADRFQSAREFGDALAGIAHEHAAGQIPGSPAGARATPEREKAVRHPLSATASRGPAGRAATTRIAAAALAVLALLTVIGLLTTAAFDSELQVPPEFAPTRSDFTILGARALVPSAIYAFVAIVAFIALGYVARGLGAIVGAIPRFGPRARTTAHATAQRASRVLGTVRPGTAAAAFFLACFAITVLVIATCLPLLGALFTSDIRILGCDNRAALHTFQPAMTVLIVGLGLGWHRVFRRVEARTGQLRSVAVPRWGSAGLILLLVFVMTLPWRLLWAGGNERVRIGDERGYVLHETDNHIVLYNASRGSTTVYDSAAAASLVRLGVHGYVFEEPAVFESGMQECESVAYGTQPRSAP